MCDGCVGRFRAAAFRLDRSASPVHYLTVMGYHLRAEAAARPREEGRATRHARAPRTGVGSGYRYYGPELGRWVNRDPIGEEGGLNLYATCVNNAVDCRDVLGLMTESEFLLWWYAKQASLGLAIGALSIAEQLIWCCILNPGETHVFQTAATRMASIAAMPVLGPAGYIIGMEAERWGNRWHQCLYRWVLIPISPSAWQLNPPFA